MKAARWHDRMDIRIDDIPEPDAGPGQVKIRVACSGICGTDLHKYVAGPIDIPVGTPHPLTGGMAPVVLGHEFAGTVVAVGAGVTRVAPGDRVVVEPLMSCRQCATCHAGFYNLCDHRAFHGASGGGGSYAPFTVVEERMVHHLPDSLSFEQGALAEPAAVALHALRESRFKAGDAAAIFGAGPIGLLLLEALLLAGATAVHVVEPSPERAARARDLGATSVIDPLSEQPAKRIVERTGGGVQVAFELSGVPTGLQQAIAATAHRGETMIISVWEAPVPIDPNLLLTGERSVRAIIGYRDVFPAVLAMMAKGAFRAERLVTKRIALDDLVEEGFKPLLTDKSHVKIMVDSGD